MRQGCFQAPLPSWVPICESALSAWGLWGTKKIQGPSGNGILVVPACRGWHYPPGWPRWTCHVSRDAMRVRWGHALSYRKLR